MTVSVLANGIVNPDTAQADIQTMASWGVGGVTFGTSGSGETYSFYTPYMSNPVQRFSGSPGTTQPASNTSYYYQWQYRTIAEWCHNATVSTTVGSGSTGGQISTIATWGGTYGGNHTLDIATPVGAFPSSGTATVATSGGTAVITYTGTTTTSLTGCTYISGTGTVSTGGVITVPWPIACYANLQAFNVYQNSSTPNASYGTIGPLLGNFNPNFTDPNGNGWPQWYQVCEDLGDALVWMGFDGIYFDCEDGVFDSSGGTTWCAGYYANNYGGAYTLPNSTPVSGTTVAQERAWAEAAGAAMMGAINSGRTDLHANNENNYPMLNYTSCSVSRVANIPDGVWSAMCSAYGTTATVNYLGSTTVGWTTAMLDYSSYLWFMKGMASATTGDVVFGDSAFYNYNDITAANAALPWYSSAGGNTAAQDEWVSAIAYNSTAFENLSNGTTIAGFTLSSNCYTSPQVWILDGNTSVAGAYNATLTQTQWNNTYPALWAGSQAGMYFVWQYFGLTYGTGLGLDYAHNSYVSPAYPNTTGTATNAGANYTPLGNAPGTLYESSVGPASASTSTVVASPTSILANGSTTSTITVTLTDASSNPISGKTITLAAGSGSSTITTVSGTTSDSGVATFTVKDATAQAVTYTATDTTDTVTITQTATVTFTPVSVTAYVMPPPGQCQRI